MTISCHSNPVFVFSLRTSSSPAGVSDDGIGMVKGTQSKEFMDTLVYPLDIQLPDWQYQTQRIH